MSEFTLPSEVVVPIEVIEALADNGCCPNHDAEIRRQAIDEFKHFIEWFNEKTHYVIINTDDFLTEEYVHCYPLEDIFAEWEQRKEVRNEKIL